MPRWLTSLAARRIGLRPFNVWLEPLLLVVILGAVVRAFFYFKEYSHFPQPFFYEPFDVWMDWFNVSYWAYNKGAYDAWGAMYPPLSFVFLHIFSLSSCYKEASGYGARECDWVGLTTLFGFFLLNIVLLWLTYRKIDRSTAWWRSLGLGLGLPSLFGLERGNLVVVTFTFVILGLGPLLKSARLRWLALGLAINFKVYIIAGLFPHLLRRRWLWFEGGLVATVVVYLVTYGVMGEGTPKQLYENIADVSGLYQAVTFLDLWYAATYKPLISLMSGQYAMVSALAGSRNVDLLLIVLPTIDYAVIGLIGLAAAAAWFRPESVPMHRLTFLGLTMAMLVAEPGGYTECFMIFFVFMEKWKGFARPLCIVLSYVLLMPFDITLDQVPPTVQESYLAGHSTFFAYYITVGPFVRPLFILIIAATLSLCTIGTVWGDIQRQGWSRRWRYRHDGWRLPGMVAPRRVKAQPDQAETP